VSLRTDIHLAFDELAPATAGMPDRVVQSAARERGRRQSLSISVIRLRAPMSLVAVLLVIAIVAGILIGGLLLSQQIKGVPAGQLDPGRLHQLESKSLNLNLVPATAPCPATQFDQTTGWWGAGPIYFYSETSSGYGSVTSTRWGVYVPYVAEVPVGLQGAVLVRGRNLITGQPVVFVGAFAAGQIVGSDTLSGRAVQQHAELAFDASRPSSRANEGFIPWGLTAGVSADPSQKPISGPVTLGPSFCVGIQIDGPGFTETFALTI